MQKIIPYLWFDTQAEEAANFYISVFKDGKILEVNHFPDNVPGPKGKVMQISFEIMGQQYYALNGGPEFPFTSAISFYVNCKNQEEVNYYWDKLQEGGGKPVQCGWLTDRFGLSWQIVPEQLETMMKSEDKEKASRVVAKMLTMIKLDVAELEAAYNGE